MKAFNDFLMQGNSKVNAETLNKDFLLGGDI